MSMQRFLTSRLVQARNPCAFKSVHFGEVVRKVRLLCCCTCFRVWKLASFHRPANLQQCIKHTWIMLCWTITFPRWIHQRNVIKSKYWVDARVGDLIWERPSLSLVVTTVEAERGRGRGVSMSTCRRLKKPRQRSLTFCPDREEIEAAATTANGTSITTRTTCEIEDSDNGDQRVPNCFAFLLLQCWTLKLLLPTSPVFSFTSVRLSLTPNVCSCILRRIQTKWGTDDQMKNRKKKTTITTSCWIPLYMLP